MEYKAEKKAKKEAYKRLKQIARLQGKKPPPNPYPSAVRGRFTGSKILEIVQKMKEGKNNEMAMRGWSGGDR
ncbi:hypothetical protein AMTRI_Chr05g69400 [Amborella trichopoda]